jgi:4-hydroxy-tetrahydrodipicolinate synthase
MEQHDWRGVFPAITTPFRADGGVDHQVLARHAEWLVERGSRGIVALGSLGEGATLSFDEKREVLATLARAAAGRAPVVAGVAALSTAEAVAIARGAAEVGCEGLMVLPPYVYIGDWADTRAHIDAVIDATPLSCMLYNNPIAYRTDFLPEQVATLRAAHDNLHAVKDSSGDVRRITAIVSLLGERINVFVGLDDCAVEGASMGASGWVAGLVNALPDESVRLFELALAGRLAEARALYDWFLPLLRLDTHPKFVQYIKLVQQEVGRGSERVRAPRLALEGEERERILEMIRERLASKPDDAVGYQLSAVDG